MEFSLFPDTVSITSILPSGEPIGSQTNYMKNLNILKLCFKEEVTSKIKSDFRNLTSKILNQFFLIYVKFSDFQIGFILFRDTISIANILHLESPLGAPQILKFHRLFNQKADFRFACL